MALPIRTTMNDVQGVCSYLAKKPTGATLKEAKAVIDPKLLDGRKLSAFKVWGLITEDDDGRLKVTEAGRLLQKSSGEGKSRILVDVVRRMPPYEAIIERAAHRHEESLSAAEVGAHWYEHFKDEVAATEKTLNDQAICFFHVAEGAGLGTLVLGRKNSPTRFNFDLEAAATFVGDAKQDETEVTLADIIEDEQTPSKNGSSASDEPVAPIPEQVVDEQQGQGIFVAHGKNKKPLEQLKSILDQFKIPYRVATDEPNLGRPISTKVRETMKACNCAILVFTADEELMDKEGNVIWRPSENVVHELGAAGYLYGDRIVIMKENSVNFPSNFADLGYISFEKDQLEAKAMEVLKELIGFQIVKVST